MELYLTYILCVILCVHVNHSCQQSAIPSSPCPAIFQYKHDGIELFGMTQIQGLPLGQSTKLEVILSLRAVLPYQYVRSLELYGSREAAIKEIRSNQPVRYRVPFPLQNPLPKLTQISVNERILCTGPPEIGLYTQIKLEHTLYTELAALAARQYTSVPVSAIADKLNAHDPFVIYNNQDDFYPELSHQQRPHYISTTTQAPVPAQQPQYQFQWQYQQPQHIPQPQYQQPSYTSQSDSEICGKPHDRFNFAPLIVGGDTVARGSWPWLIAVCLNKPSGLSFNCGGTLVSSKVVVTAAHCFRTSKRQYAASDVVLFLGRYNILNWNEDGSKVVKAEQIIIHDDYMLRDSSFDADVALVIMADRVQFTEFIRPVCLWEGSTNVQELVGIMGTVFGWGQDGSGNIVSNIPKKINIPIVPEAECLRSSDTYLYITSNRTYCAGRRDGTGPCKGDSGGGMIFRRNKRWMLRGIVSAALADPIVNSCNLGEYVVFTDAAKFGSWIKFYMR